MKTERDSGEKRIFHHSLMIGVVIGFFVVCVGWATDAAATISCEATDPGSLQQCVQKLRNHQADELVITQTITCSQPAQCLMDLSGVANKRIRGAAGVSPHFKRVGYHDYQIIHVGIHSDAHDLLIENLVFDEDAGDTARPPLGSYPGVIFIDDGKNIWLDGISLRHWKDVGMRVSNVENFVIRNSVFEAGQHIALIFGSSVRNVHVRNNTFRQVETNALAFTGSVLGTSNDNIIDGNSFRENHYYGLYNSCSGNICNGGMMYLKDGDNLTISNNAFRDGYCTNCPDNEVHGIEMDGVANVVMRNNTFQNITGSAFYHNWWEGSLSNVSIMNNTMANNRRPWFSSGLGQLQGSVSIGSNYISNTDYEIGWESSSDYPSGWRTRANCGTGGESVNRTSLADAIQGVHALRLKTASFQSGCSNPHVATESAKISVSPGQRIDIAELIRGNNATAATGVVFYNSYHQVVDQGEQTYQKLGGSFHVESGMVEVPSGAAYMAVKFVLRDPNVYVDHDYSRVAIGPKYYPPPGYNPPALPPRPKISDTAPPPTWNPPKGHHDQANADFTSGWTCDPDDFSAALAVHFYEGTTLIGHTIANREREEAVGQQCGGHRYHGFVWHYPPELRDGSEHTIKAYALNHDGQGDNPLLGGSPISVTIPVDQPAATPAAAGRTGNVVNHSWRAVDWGMSLSDPVVIAGLGSFNGSDPAALRIKNVTTTGFTVKVEEDKSYDSEMWHANEDVHYLVAGAGAIRSDSGAVIGEAGRVSNSQLNGGTWHTVSLKQTYQATPVVLMNMVTFNGGQPSHVRLRNVTKTSFQYQIEEWDHLDQGHTTETMHYIVLSPGVHTVGGAAVQAGLLDGVQRDWVDAPYLKSFTNLRAIVSQVQTYNDAAAVVTRQTSVTNKSMKVQLQEEERQEVSNSPHAGETVGIIAVGE